MKTPQLSASAIESIIAANNVPRDRFPVILVGIRGYYLDSMGAPGANDRRRYDDAHFLYWPDGIARFVANCDPNGARKGSGTGGNKGMASLKTGIHLFGQGKHKGRPGFRQAEPFTVIRDGLHGDYDDTGMHAINIHSGGGDEDSVGTTSSLGCQTQPPAQWRVFQPLAYELLDQYGNEMGNNDWHERVQILPYILIDETERRKGNLLVSRRFLG